MTYRDEETALRAKLEKAEHELAEERRAGARLIDHCEALKRSAARPPRFATLLAALTRLWGAEAGWREELRTLLMAIGTVLACSVPCYAIVTGIYSCTEASAKQASLPPPVDECVEICERFDLPFLRRGASNYGYPACMCVAAHRVCKYVISDGDVRCWTMP